MNDAQKIAAIRAILDSPADGGGDPQPQPQPQPGPTPTPQPTGPIPPGSIAVLWATSKTWDIPMQCTQTMIFVLDVPADAKPGQYPNQLNFAEYQGPPTIRQAMLSRVAGSFDLADAITGQQGNQVSIPVLAGSNVAPGGRYFINVRNWSTDLDAYSCTPGAVMGSRASWVTSN